MTAPVPSPDLREALEWAELMRGCQVGGLGAVAVLADEILRLRSAAQGVIDNDAEQS